MAITDKEKGVWGLDQVYNKINQGSIWEYSGISEVWAFGFNNYGMLADNSTVNKSSPVQIPGTTWSSFNSGAYGRGYLATKTDGTLWTWGRNNQGQLADNSTVNKSSPIQIPGTWATEDNKIYRARECAAIKADGTLWSWGYNGYGQLGQNNRTKYSSPVQIPGTTWSSVITAGATIATKTDGTLWSWGYNIKGNLGQNDTVHRSSPVQIAGTGWDKFYVTGTDNAIYAIKTNGELWAWGSASEGLLANNLGPTGPRSSPVQIAGTWADFSTCLNSVGGIKTDGTMWRWGYNGNGQTFYNKGYSGTLGYGWKAASSPTQIPGTTWRNVAGASHFWVATKTDGTLWGMGENTGGSLGQNSTTHPAYSSPVQVPGTDWVKSICTQYSTIGKKTI